VRAVAERAGERESFALLAPPTFNLADRGVELSLRQRRGAGAKPGPHGRVLRAKPQPAFNAEFEGIDLRCCVKGTMDCRDRRFNGAAGYTFISPRWGEVANKASG
jgi:hypothetical protein